MTTVEVETWVEQWDDDGNSWVEDVGVRWAVWVGEDGPSYSVVATLAEGDRARWQPADDGSLEAGAWARAETMLWRHLDAREAA